MAAAPRKRPPSSRNAKAKLTTISPNREFIPPRKRRPNRQATSEFNLPDRGMEFRHRTLMTKTGMWKANWEQTKQRFVDWWNHEGLLIGMWGAPETGRCIHENVPAPVKPATLEERYCNAAFRAAEHHYRLSRSVFPADVLPSATTDLGPGSLALFLGAKPGFAEDTVWFH